MNHRVQLAAWLPIAGIAVLLISGCLLEGSGPGLVTAPDPKPAEEGAPPHPPAADPAIAFVSGQDLKVMDADGSNVTTIYTKAGTDFLPSWSPGGQSIAFHANVAGSSSSDLARIDVTVVNGVPTGTNLVAVVTRTTPISSVTWSPLGEQIAFTDINLRTLETVPAIGGSPVVVYTSPPNVIPRWPVWSRDGTKIAFVEWDFAGSGYAIRAVDIPGGTVTTLLGPGFSQQEGGSLIRWPDWGRTRDVLTFESNGGVYILELTGGTPTLVVSGSAPTWSPDDTKIVFTAQKISKVDLATGVVTRFRNSGSFPDWRRF